MILTAPKIVQSHAIDKECVAAFALQMVHAPIVNIT